MIFDAKNGRDPGGNSLLAAVVAGACTLSLVRVVLKWGVDINAVNDRCPPHETACWESLEYIVSRISLLERALGTESECVTPSRKAWPTGSDGGRGRGAEGGACRVVASETLAGSLGGRQGVDTAVLLDRASGAVARDGSAACRRYIGCCPPSLLYSRSSPFLLVSPSVPEGTIRCRPRLGPHGRSTDPIGGRDLPGRKCSVPPLRVAPHRRAMAAPGARAPCAWPCRGETWRWWTSS